MASAAHTAAGSSRVLAADDDEEIMSLRKRIEAEHRMSVVRLRIAKTGDVYGRCTGFIVLNSPTKLAVMTCGHSFREWARGTMVEVTFFDGGEASAKVVWYNLDKEVALPIVDTSSKRELSNADLYPPVTFSYSNFRKGDFLLMLGYPYSMHGLPEMGNFYGHVTNEAAPVRTGPGCLVPLVSGDYPIAGGASGAPIFGKDGTVVGIAISGVQDMSFTLPVTWIQQTLNEMDEVKRRRLQNLTILEVIELCYVTVPPPAHAGAGSSSGGPDAQASGREDQGPSHA